MPRSIFVTGASGFLGGSIATSLVARRWHVVGLARTAERAGELQDAGIEALRGDLDDVEALTHGARTTDATINAADSDHRGCLATLVEALARTGKPLLHTSGSSIVADDAAGRYSPEVYDESIYDAGSGWRPTAGRAARVEIDRFALAAADRGVRSVVICNSLIYGHGRGISRDSAQIPTLLELARRSGTARHIGPGANVWSTVFIDDVVDLYLRALENAPAGSFYFAEHGEARFGDIADAIARTLGLGPPEPITREAAIAEWGHGPAVYSLGSNSRVRGPRARSDLGWRPAGPSLLDWIAADMLT